MDIKITQGYTITVWFDFINHVINEKAKQSWWQATPLLDSVFSSKRISQVTIQIDTSFAPVINIFNTLIYLTTYTEFQHLIE